MIRLKNAHRLNLNDFSYFASLTAEVPNLFHTTVRICGTGGAQRCSGTGLSLRTSVDPFH